MMSGREICRVVKVEETFGTRYYAERLRRFLILTWWEPFYISGGNEVLNIYYLKEHNRATGKDVDMKRWADPSTAEWHCKEYMRINKPDQPIKVWSINEENEDV